MSNKPPCKKRFLAKTIHDLGEFTRHYGLTPPEGCDDSLKVLEQKPWGWFAQTLHAVSDDIYGHSIGAGLRPMDRLWGTAMSVAYEPACVSRLVFINVPPRRSPERSMDCVGLLLAIDRERTSQRLYQEDGGPVGWDSRYHLQRLDGSVITWGNCTPRNIISHRIAEMNRKVHHTVYGA